MNRSISTLALAFALCVTSVAPAQGIADRVRLARGTETGEITDMTPLELTLNKGRPNSRTVAVNEIRTVLFADEPSELAQARVNAANGSYENALTALEKLN